MPTPLQILPIRAPGSFGLDTARQAALDDPRWASDLSNAVFDDAGRVAARKGLTALTTTGAHSSDTAVIHEYIIDKDSSQIISAAGLKLYEGTTTLTEITDIEGGGTADDWQFANFNGKLIGFQQGHQPIVYTGTGTFSDLNEVSGVAPTGNAGLAAFGRLWGVDADKTTVKWSGSLD